MDTSEQARAYCEYNLDIQSPNIWSAASFPGKFGDKLPGRAAQSSEVSPVANCIMIDHYGDQGHMGTVQYPAHSSKSI